MSRVDHWHPVYDASRLADKPVGIRLNGREIVLFRTSNGAIGALNDICPHRRMRLSLGKIKGDRLQCPYHGWTFTCAGAGESPGTPKLHADAYHYETAERYGCVWIKSAESSAAMPEFEIDGYHHACTVRHTIHAPLEVVLDNFTEVEHTSTVHYLLGYSLDNMSQVVTRVDSTDDTVHVYNEGPQKPIPGWLALLMGFRLGDTFVDEWTTRFSPVYTCYDQWWFDPSSGGERRDRLRIYVFFNPVGPMETDLHTFVYTKSRLWGATAVRLWIGPFLRFLVDLEIKRDVATVEKLADKSPDIAGLRLSRFDRVLGLNRKRIAAIYDGLKEPVPPSPVML